MFACLYEQGVGLKLTQARAAELIGSEGITYFQPLGRAVMKQWVQINRAPGDYALYVSLFIEAAGYAAD